MDAAVAVVDEAGGGPTDTQGHVEGVEGQRGVEPLAEGPADDPVRRAEPAKRSGRSG